MKVNTVTKRTHNMFKFVIIKDYTKVSMHMCYNS